MYSFTLTKQVTLLTFSNNTTFMQFLRIIFLRSFYWIKYALIDAIFVTKIVTYVIPFLVTG